MNKDIIHNSFVDLYSNISFEYKIVYRNEDFRGMSIDPPIKQLQITYNTELGSSSIVLDERQLNLCLDVFNKNFNKNFKKEDNGN